MLRPIAFIVTYSILTTIGRCEEALPTKDVMTGTVAAIYTSPDSAWYSIFAGPSKFQKLTPKILLVDTGEKKYHVHALEAVGAIPAEVIAVAGRPGTRQVPNPLRLQIASSSMPQIGAPCAMETFTSSDGLIYAVHGSLRLVGTKAAEKEPDDQHRTEP